MFQLGDKVITLDNLHLHGEIVQLSSQVAHIMVGEQRLLYPLVMLTPASQPPTLGVAVNDGMKVGERLG